MIIKTKDFQEVANKILLAVDVDKNVASLELLAFDRQLTLSVTNKEFYVSVSFGLAEPANMHAVVDASLFLSLVSGLTTDEFELTCDANKVMLKAGKSSYKLAQIFENDHLMDLPVIAIQNKTVEMKIPQEVLSGILGINGREVAKAKSLDVSELQKLYYVDETGCFTFTNCATLNSFRLDKPVKLLLSDRVVKLFKLFKGDVDFAMGQDEAGPGLIQTKVEFRTADTYLAALVTCDDILLKKVQGPCAAAKTLIGESYPLSLVVSANSMLAAISRIMMFTKNSVDKANMSFLPVKVDASPDSFAITDNFGNKEVVDVENGSAGEPYSFYINISDIKSAIEPCKNERVTINCGAKHAVVINHGNVSNLIPEVVKKDEA